MGMFSWWVTRKWGQCHCHIDVPMSIAVWPCLVLCSVSSSLSLHPPAEWQSDSDSMTRSWTLVLASTSSLSAPVATDHCRGNNVGKSNQLREAPACSSVFAEVWSDPLSTKRDTLKPQSHGTSISRGSHVIGELPITSVVCAVHLHEISLFLNFLTLPLFFSFLNVG